MIYATLGYEPLPAQALIRYARGKGPADEIEAWADVYAELSPIAGVRTALAWAQACHETGYFKYQGDAKPDWNNPCGLGVGALPLVRNGVEVPNSSNCRFPDKQTGCRAHLGHLSVYFAPFEVTGFCEFDPRHVPHKRLVNDARELGKRWAPNPLYGADRAIEAYTVLTLI